MTIISKLEIEEVDGNSDLSKILASLAQLENLDCLILKGFRFRSMPSLDEVGILRSLTKLKLKGLLTRLPSANSFPPNISYLTLVNTSLDEDPMPELEKLPNLIYLKLRNAYTGRQMMISRGSFPILQILCIGELWHLRNVQFGEGAMPELKRLDIDNTPYLKNVPEEMITSVSQLKLLTTKRIATKIRESGLIFKIRYVDMHP